MSKNTGTSELINYFDLGVNGDVGIAGSLDINTIANATTDTDTFLVSDTGIIKYRTGAQLLSDIGAAPATGGSYLPLAGGTLTGTLNGTSAVFSSDIQSNTRLISSNGGQAIFITANSGGLTNRIEATSGLPLHIVTTGSSLALAAGGTTPQFTLASTGVVTLSNLAGTGSRIVVSDASGNLSASALINGYVQGSGTTNYLPKFTGSTTIGNSQIIDNGSQVGIGLTPNASYGTLQIKSPSSVYSIDLVGRTAGLNSENQITFWNSTQTTGLAYIYNSLSNLYLGTGANQPFTLSSGGNFIFGSTTDNGARLQVSGSGVAFNFTTSNGLIGNINSSAANGGYVTWQTSGTTIADLGTAQQVFGAGGSDTFGINARGSRSLILGTNNTARLTIASTGAATFSSSVNLGTNANAADTASLNIKQSGTSYNNGIYIERGGERNGYHMYIGGALDSLTFRRNYFGTQSDVMSLTRDGKVGIGMTTSEYGIVSIKSNSTTPYAGFNVYATGNGNFTYINHDNSVGIIGTEFGAGGTGQTPLTFQVGGSERMRITSGGYLKSSNNGIYNNATGAFHEFNQNLITGQVSVFRNSATSVPQGIEIAFTGADPNDTGSYMLGSYATSGGFVWIYRIFSNGTVSARSDSRWKKNIETTRNGYIDDLCKLRVVKYNWYNHEDDVPKELGLIAQEVEEVFPNLIQIDPVIAKREVEQEDGTIIEEEFEDGVSRSIKTSVLPFMLLKAMQEQQEQIKELQVQIDKLKNL